MYRSAVPISLLGVLTFTAVSLGQVTLPRVGWEVEIAYEEGDPAVRIGVDLGDGSGFSFQTLVDDNGDGIIRLPLVPVGGRFAIGGTDAGGVVGCDLWDIIGTQVVVGTTIQKPLLFIAEDIEGVTLGVDFGNFTEPPFALTPGTRYSVIDGRVAGWPEPRFVNDFGVPGLEEFVQTVEFLPNFNGDVLVSNAYVEFTFVPEPVSAALLATVAICLGAFVRLRISFPPSAAHSKRVPHGVLLLVAFFTVLIPPRAAEATSFTWVYAGDGNWETPTNWTPYIPLPPNPIVGPPTTGDAAIINTPVNVIVQDNFVARGLASLSLFNGASVNTNFNLVTTTLDTGTTTVNGVGSRLVVREDAGTEAYVATQMNLVGGGELDIEGPKVSVLGSLDIDPASIVTGRGVLSMGSSSAVLTNRGTIRPDQNQTLTIGYFSFPATLDLDGSGASSAAHLDVANSGASLFIDQELADEYGGLITLGTDSELGVNADWTLGGDNPFPARIDFDAGDLPNSANITGGDLTLGGPSINHAAVHGLSGSGNFDVPVTIHPNTQVTVDGGSRVEFNDTTTIHGGTFTTKQNGNIDFNGPTTIYGGSFNTHSISLIDGVVEFNAATEYAGNITVNGIVRQQEDATVSAATVITADAFDIDGTPGGNVFWDINAPLTVNAERIGAGNSFFGGTFQIDGPASAWVDINISNSSGFWLMGGTMNLVGAPIGFANRVRGSRMEMTGALNIQQRVEISADMTLATGSTTDIDAASHVLQLSGTTVVEAGATISGDGYLQNAASGNMSLPTGLSTGNVGLSNEGILRLGDAVGVVSVAEFVQSDGATLVVDVGRNTLGTDSDVLTTSSSGAFVDGFVQPNIVNVGGTFQEPQVGDSFTILTAVGGVSGMFDDVLDAALGGMTYSWTLIHNPNNVQIQLASVGGLLGDYNLDGTVNAADYTVWRNTLGSMNSLAADGNKNGQIDQGDYTVWVDHYGTSLGVGSNADDLSGVPEPGAALMLASAALLLFARRNKFAR